MPDGLGLTFVDHDATVADLISLPAIEHYNKNVERLEPKMVKTSKEHAMFFFPRAGEFFSAAEKLFASENRAKAPNKWEYPIYFCYSQWQIACCSSVRFIEQRCRLPSFPSCLIRTTKGELPA